MVVFENPDILPKNYQTGVGSKIKEKPKTKVLGIYSNIYIYIYMVILHVDKMYINNLENIRYFPDCMSKIVQWTATAAYHINFMVAEYIRNGKQIRYLVVLVTDTGLVQCN